MSRFDSVMLVLIPSEPKLIDIEDKTGENGGIRRSYTVLFDDFLSVGFNELLLTESKASISLRVVPRVIF